MLPIDVIKSRQQVLSIGSKVPIRFGSCAKDLYRMAGFKGFYAGLLPMLLRTIPANGALRFGRIYRTTNTKCFILNQKFKRTHYL